MIIPSIPLPQGNALTLGVLVDQLSREGKSKREEGHQKGSRESLGHDDSSSQSSHDTAPASPAPQVEVWVQCEASFVCTPFRPLLRVEQRVHHVCLPSEEEHEKRSQGEPNFDGWGSKISQRQWPREGRGGQESNGVAQGHPRAGGVPHEAARAQGSPSRVSEGVRGLRVGAREGARGRADGKKKERGSEPI